MKANGLTVSVTGLPVVQELCQAIIDTSKDERIPVAVREELIVKVDGIIDRIAQENVLSCGEAR